MLPQASSATGPPCSQPPAWVPAALTRWEGRVSTEKRSGQVFQERQDWNRVLGGKEEAARGGGRKQDSRRDVEVARGPPTPTGLTAALTSPSGRLSRSLGAAGSPLPGAVLAGGWGQGCPGTTTQEAPRRRS